jgi:hypothetical protein
MMSKVPIQTRKAAERHNISPLEFFLFNDFLCNAKAFQRLWHTAIDADYV